MMTGLTETSLNHHALLIRGERESALRTLEEVLGISFATTADPDIAYSVFESMGIDEVRALTYVANRLPIAGDVLRLIIATDAITHEAQNALLKLTEDPPVHARFIFVLPHSFPVLPTFRSRFEEVILASEDTRADAIVGTIGAQLERVGKMTKDGDNQGMEELLMQAEREIAQQIALKKTDTSFARALILARRYIEARGAAPKMLLEHLLIARATPKEKG